MKPLHWTGQACLLDSKPRLPQHREYLPPLDPPPTRGGIRRWGRTPGDGPAQPEFGGAPTASFSKVQAVYLLARFRSGT
jgi:hypothetical protein